MTIEKFDDFYYNTIINSEEAQPSLELFGAYAEKIGFKNPREEAEEVYRMVVLSMFDIETEKLRFLNDKIHKTLAEEAVLYLMKKRLIECGII